VVHCEGQDEQVHDRAEEEVENFRWEVRRDERCVLPVFLQTNREVRDRIVHQSKAESTIRLDNVSHSERRELRVIFVGHCVVVQLQGQVRSKVLKGNKLFLKIVVDDDLTAGNVKQTVIVPINERSVSTFEPLLNTCPTATPAPFLIYKADRL
jgi:hypothetical protein